MRLPTTSGACRGTGSLLLRIAGTLFLHPSVAQKGTETARQLERSNSNSDKSEGQGLDFDRPRAGDRS